jgi:hypothetical protein
MASATMIRTTLLTLLLCLAANVRSECECLWQGPFSRVVGSTDLVVTATVTGSQGNSIDVHIERVLRGEHYSEEVRIWLDSGGLCRPAIDTFAHKSQWVMALDLIDTTPTGGFNPNTPSISHGRIGDYSISKCGGYWLSREGELVSGNLTGGPRWEMNPKMSPVLLELVAGFVAGSIDEETLKEAGQVDPALQELILETRLFLRRQH